MSPNRVETNEELVPIIFGLPSRDRGVDRSGVDQPLECSPVGDPDA